MRTRHALTWRTVASAIALVLSGAPSASAEQPSATRPRDIVTYRIRNFGPAAENSAVTFGSVFARGDVPAGAGIEAVDENGNPVPLQLDRKATHGDRSLRHAVVTLVIPDIKSKANIAVMLRRTAAASGASAAVSLADLPKDFDVSIILAMDGKSLSVSARALLAAGRPETWLAGPYVSEWWLTGAFRDKKGVADPHLRAQIGIRCYGRDRPLRIETIVENDWTHILHPRTESYDAEIRLGTRTTFAKTKMVQPSYTRWREGFWWEQPIPLYLEQNLAYLKKARVIPNYDPDLKISPAAISDMYRLFADSDREPMAAGIITKYMPTTGGRPDIAPLPQWQALYLLSMDPRMYQVMLQTADLGASFASHYRNEKTGRPITLEDDPNITTHSNYVGRPAQLEIPDTGGYKDPLVPDAAHEPALDFVPYLVTGDRFYLEELQFWSQWNEMGTAPEYHGYAKALVNWDQVRAQAWSLRTLAQAEYIVPDQDPLKPVLGRELKANIEWYQQKLINNSSASKLHTVYDENTVYPWDGGRGIAPFEDDFFTWTMDYINALGDVRTLPLLQWKAVFPVGRMVAPGFCWILAPSYTLIARDSPHAKFYDTFKELFLASLPTKLQAHSGLENVECAGSEMAKALALRLPGEMVQQDDNAQGFSAYLQAALAAAVDSNAIGANLAWRRFTSRPVKPDYSTAPGWDIVPMDD